MRLLERDGGQLQPPFLQRVRAANLQRVDYAVALLLLLATFPHLHGGPGRGVGASLVLAFGAALPIALRRRYPFASLGIATVAIAIATAVGQTFAPDPLIAVPMYQVASVHERRESFKGLGVTSVVLIIAAVVGASTHPGEGEATFSILLAIAAWFVGDAVRVRRDYNSGLAEQAAQRASEASARESSSVAEERLRIARELHDVVAHSLSVIAIQSAVGGHVIDEQPEQAKAALAAVEETSRAALGELRRILGVLRHQDGAEPDFAPAPGLGDLETLVEQIRSTGQAVEVRVDAQALSGLSSGVELSIYRIVQEALTNIVKHTSGALAQVEVRRERDELVVEVTDDGGGSVVTYPVEASGHHGIIGMRERAALFNGTLAAGPRPGGGFRVLARLPLGEHSP